VSVPGPVTAADVEEAVEAAVLALQAVVDQDWRVPAGDLRWDCFETIEHIADDLFAYAGQLGPKQPPLDTYVPFAWERKREGGPVSTIFVQPDKGQPGLLQVLEACGTMLTAVVWMSSHELRSYHPYGVSDPEGFAAMGVVETLVHMYDVAQGIGFVWDPAPGLCARALHRLFPAAPTDTDPWVTLLWATGRGDLPGRARLDEWRWDPTPR
jgi:hypothetical protein